MLSKPFTIYFNLVRPIQRLNDILTTVMTAHGISLDYCSDLAVAIFPRATFGRPIKPVIYSKSGRIAKQTVARLCEEGGTKLATSSRSYRAVLSRGRSPYGSSRHLPAAALSVARTANNA